jgi:haloalkane dehalogenase
MIGRRELVVGMTAALLPRSQKLTALGPVKRHFDVLGLRMAAIDTDPTPPNRRTFVFLHGNPTSSYLWRRVIPALAPFGRCLAPDLAGMGDSAKLPVSGPGRYSVAEQSRYLDALLDTAAPGNRIVLVLHDWGGALGFDWARRHPDRVIGIAHTETVMDGISSATAPPPVTEFFRRYRGSKGEAAVLQENQFVEQVLFGSLGDRLTPADRDEYRRPFARAGEDRRPTLTFPQQIPIDGDPADVAETIAQGRAWLAETPIPKLFVNAEPGALVSTPGRRATCRSWPNTTEVTVKSRHFVPEEAPDALAAGLVSWARNLKPPR